MVIEDKAKELIDEFKIKMLSEVKTVLDGVYGEILPHAENDTYMNVSMRTESVIKNLLAGNFTETGKGNKVLVCDDNETLLQLLADAVHKYCLSGDCNSLGLLLKATSYLFQSGEQLLSDNQICQSCGDRGCSAAGSADGLDS